MIVPDKKTATYLNEPVTPKGVLRLCRAGVVSAFDFLKAAALCRSDKKWSKFIVLILRFLSGLSFLSAIFFFTISQWDFFYRTSGFTLLCVLFVLCAWFRDRFGAADYVGAGLIGFMIFLPDVVFRTNVFLYEQFFLWFVLLVVWSCFARQCGLWLLSFFVLNVAILLYGVQFVVPSFIFSLSEFCLWSALFNLSCLIVLEKVSEKRPDLILKGFRFFPLLWAFSLLLLGCVSQCVASGKISFSDSCFLLCLLSSVFCGYVYRVRIPDRRVQRLVLLFGAICLVCLCYRFIYFFIFAPRLQNTLFFFVFSGIAGGALIWERLSALQVKGYENVD